MAAGRLGPQLCSHAGRRKRQGPPSECGATWRDEAHPHQRPPGPTEAVEVGVSQTSPHVAPKAGRRGAGVRGGRWGVCLPFSYGRALCPEGSGQQRQPDEQQRGRDYKEQGVPEAQSAQANIPTTPRVQTGRCTQLPSTQCVAQETLAQHCRFLGVFSIWRRKKTFRPGRQTGLEGVADQCRGRTSNKKWKGDGGGVRKGSQAERRCISALHPLHHQPWGFCPRELPELTAPTPPVPTWSPMLPVDVFGEPGIERIFIYRSSFLPPCTQHHVGFNRKAEGVANA